MYEQGFDADVDVSVCGNTSSGRMLNKFYDWTLKRTNLWLKKLREVEIIPVGTRFIRTIEISL